MGSIVKSPCMLIEHYKNFKQYFLVFLPTTVQGPARYARVKIALDPSTLQYLSFVAFFAID